ncbi:MAG: DUF4168 domain-containing protein [Rhodanobacteraceae bacterium]|nr:MAG: DUF4168 domain-containing protein [Rhodanobacteraceae bacterium]
MNPRLHRVGAAVAVALGVGMLAPMALAQTQPAAQPQQAPSQNQAAAHTNTGPAPTDAELQHFAQAAREVETIKQTAQPQIAQAKSAGDRTKLQKSAEQEMEAAVRSNDLSVQRYEQIAMVAQTDSKVRTKLIKLMQQPKPPTS